MKLHRDMGKYISSASLAASAAPRASDTLISFCRYGCSDMAECNPFLDGLRMVMLDSGHC